MNATLAEFAAAAGGTVRPAGADLGTTVAGVSIHSQRLGSRSAFVALRGARSDGHDFVAKAAAGGAAVCVVRADWDGLADAEGVGTPLVVVDDTLAALQSLAAWWRGRLRATVVAVAGGIGKTTTKDALAQLLPPLGTVFASPGSYNSQLGVPLAVLQCPEDVDFAVFETAATAPGELARLAGIVRPDLAVVTNLGTRWSGNFPSREAQAAATADIGGTRVLLGEADPLLLQAFPAPVVLGDEKQLPVFTAENRTSQGFDLGLAFPDGATASVHLPVASAEAVRDIELATAAAYLLGASAAAILETLDGYQPPSTQTEILKTPRGFTLVREVTTPDPLALTSGIRTATALAGGWRRLAVVLGEPAKGWPADGYLAEAQVILAENVKTVYAVEHPYYRSLQGELAGHDDVVVELFPDARTLREELLAAAQPGDVILVQAPRDAEVADVSQELIESIAPTRLYVDLQALELNVASFRAHVGPEVQILGMVKALAYGTDAVAIGLALQQAGIDRLGVSTAEEGAALRRAGVQLPILVMMAMPADFEKLQRHRLTPVVYGQNLASALEQALEREGGTMRVHVEVDTGMHRLGLSPDAAVALLERVKAGSPLQVEGIMTHFASADDPTEDDATDSQLLVFRGVLDRAADLGYTSLVRHAAATSATLRRPEAHFDMVRVGIGLHGISPLGDEPAPIPLHPTYTLRSRLIEILTLNRGDRVGYGGTYPVPSDGTRIGVVAAGYFDGLPRAFSNTGHVVVKGKECPITGRISMDSLAVDLTNCPEATVGSEVLLYGTYADSAIPLEDVARRIGTIPYELMTGVGGRVQRIFTKH